MDSATVIDTDVHNMARWGILFQECPEWFHGSWAPGESHKGNVWNYIDHFGERQETAEPLKGWTGGDTPLFWELWNEYTVRPDNPYMPIREPRRELLADWERELLPDYVGSVFAQLIADRNLYYLNYLD